MFLSRLNGGAFFMLPFQSAYVYSFLSYLLQTIIAIEYNDP